MKPYVSRAIRIGKNITIGGVAGWAAGRSVTDAEGAEAGGRMGLRVGMAIGAAASLPVGKMAVQAGKATSIFGKGLSAGNPRSKVGAAIRVADRAVKRGRVVFRRIHGRIIPIIGK